MSSFHLIPFAAALVLSTAALAQQAPAPAPAPETPAPTATPQDCTRAMARHDHGAEKGTPTPMMGACPMAATPSADKATKARARIGHDHARFHKLM